MPCNIIRTNSVVNDIVDAELTETGAKAPNEESLAASIEKRVGPDTANEVSVSGGDINGCVSGGDTEEYMSGGDMEKDMSGGDMVDNVFGGNTNAGTKFDGSPRSEASDGGGEGLMLRGGGPFDAVDLLATEQDRIFRTNCFDEMIFPAHLAQKEITLGGVPCIVDTGCGRGYLLVPPDSSLTLVTTPMDATLCAVNGTTSKVTEAVEAFLSIRGTTKRVWLRVLTSTVDPVISVLFGRDLLSLFSITTDGGTSVRMGSEVLFVAESGKVQVEEEVVRRVADGDSDICDITPAITLPIASERVRPTPSDKQVGSVNRLLEGLVRLGPQPLPRCCGVMSLRSIAPGEEKDTPEQTHTFELKLDPKQHLPSKQRFYAQSIYEKLDEAKKGQFKEQVAEYVRNGWWSASDFESCRRQSAGPPANVFGVVQKDKFRLVCDLQAFNRSYPSTTWEQPAIEHSLAVLRLQSCATLVVGDCRSAFYRVRLSVPLWLHCGDVGNYLCWRMAFGLSMGPEGLQQSLGVLWRMFAKSSIGSGSLYVDDFWMALPEESKEDYHRWLFLLLRAGFDVPQKKFQQIFDNLGTIKIFGQLVSFGQNASLITCNREGIDDTRKRLNNDELSRRDVFGIAGVLAYDQLKVHVESKICADLLRSVAGRLGRSWGDTIKPSGDEAVLFECLKSWSRDLLNTRNGCGHSIPIQAHSLLRLVLTTDASHTGGGATLELLTNESIGKSLLLADAWIWRDVTRNYHCNRLESMALFRGLRLVANFIDFYRSAFFGEQRINAHILVQTDSSTALAWASRGARSDGYESRTIERLCVGLSNEVRHIRGSGCFVEMTHIPGLHNSVDQLSRILEKDFQGKTLSDMLNRRKGKSKKTSQTEERGSSPVRRAAETSATTPLAESVAGESFDLWQALDLMGTVARCLRSWKLGRAADELGEKEKIKLIAHSAQSVSSGQWNNPFFKDAAGVITHLRHRYNGTAITTAMIPRQCKVLSRLIVRTFHRSCHHRGAQYTANCIKFFWIEGRNSVVRDVLRSCYPCSLKNARLQWSIPTNTYPRNVCLPVFSRICIDHLHLEKVVVLSVMCIDTGVLSLLATPNNRTTIEDSLECLRRLTHRYSLTLLRIYCDNSSTFKSSKFREELRKLGQEPEIEYASPGASYTNPVERLHLEVLSIIRSKKFLRQCFVDNERVQESCDEIACIVNQRPIGVYLDEGECDDILTPAILAWGARYLTGNQRKLREYFYDRCFDDLRRTNQINRRQRRGALSVGQRALLYLKDAPKLTHPFELCRVIDINGSQITIRTSGGKIKRVGSQQLAPFSMAVHEDTYSTARYDVSRVGAKVTASFDYEGSLREFKGVVVGEEGDLVEVSWDLLDGQRWDDEYISWGACRLL